MHPAFSVILFSTLSGTGFGLWFWLGFRIAFGPAREQFEVLGWIFGLVLGALLVGFGLFASFWHLGKPLRAWRAFSQWRSSWLSREGVLAMLCFIPVLAILLLPSATPLIWIHSIGLLLSIGSIATVYCTAMIYASLKPIPAWRHPLVVPVYLLFALFAGGIPASLFISWQPFAGRMLGGFLVIGATALWLLKQRYWREIDRDPLPIRRGDAIGLPQREVSVFERPHTEANYLTREMGFVVARKHARKLRIIAKMLFAWVPMLCAVPILMFSVADTTAWLWLATVSVLLGAMVERWLFFAEAKHLVMLYY